MTAPQNRTALWLFLSAIFIALDQLSKWVVIELFFKDNLLNKPYQGFVEWMTAGFGTWSAPRLDFISHEAAPVLNIVMIWNKGVSFGMFASSHTVMPMILSGVAIVMSVIFAILLHRATHWTQALGFSAVIGGAIANVLDRARFGAVADFIDVHVGTLHWPAFNIADSLIVAGVGLLLVHGLWIETRAKRDLAAI